MRNTCQYGLAHTKTFRRVSRKLFDIWGGNLQNIEKSVRQIYIPDGFGEHVKQKCKYWLETGDLSVFTEEELETLRVFVQVDQSGAEALIVAYLCRAGSYRDLFIHGIKPHVYVAMKLFKDIWRQKMKDGGGLIEDFDIDVLSNTPIPLLKSNPFWRDLDLLIKASDNWSLQERYYYLAKQTCHCVSSDTEILTEKGWIKVPFYNGEDKIAVYDKGYINFETPSSWNSYDYIGDMILLSGDETNQLVTPNHKVVYQSNEKIHVDTADNVFKLKEPRIPVSGLYRGGPTNWPDWKIKLLVSIQADGYIINENRVQFRFAKDRKIERMSTILNESGLQHTFNSYSGDTTARNVVSTFTVTCPELISLFNGNKIWDSWLLQFSTNNLKVLLNELKFWDGSFTSTYCHKREKYSSSIPSNLKWIKTICHLMDRQGTIGEGSCSNEMGINNRLYSCIKNKIKIPYNGKVYCPTISTGMFLIRRHGKITITHNSGNYGIGENTFIMNILEKSGGKIVLSKEKGREFLMEYRGLFPEIPEWNRSVLEQVEKTGMLYNALGFPYNITDYVGDFKVIESNAKEYIAWGPQSTVGEITRIAFSRLQEHIEAAGKRWDILADTHDSMLVQCPLHEVKECSGKMSAIMNQEMTSPYDGVHFCMKSECNIGFNWNSYKPVKNELGLQLPGWLSN